MANIQDGAKAKSADRKLSRALLGTTVLTSLLSLFAAPEVVAQALPTTDQTGANGANNATAGAAGGAGSAASIVPGTGDLGSTSATFTGGNGGNGGPQQIFPPPGGFTPPGRGGVGGAGLVFTGVGAKSATLNGAITGGVGGAGGSTGGSTGAGGEGGNGIVGEDLSLTLGAMVSGGAGGVDNGTGQAARGFAINFTGGTNALTLATGGGLTGGIFIGGGSLNFAQPTDATISNIISGVGAISKTGNGVLTLSGTSSFSGGTTISGGVLAISSRSNLGSSASTNTLTINGGTLRATSGNSTFSTASIIGASNGTIETASGATINLAGTNTLTGQLIKTGEGTLRLSGTTSGGGGVALNQGLLDVTTNTALGTGQLTIASGATFAPLTAGLSIGNDITLGAGSGANISPQTSLTLGGVISGAQLNVIGGFGDLVLTGANTYEIRRAHV